MTAVLPTSEALASIPHRAYDKAELVIFAGKRGQGKTFAMREHIETREPRVLLLDPFNDFQTIVESPSVEDALDDMAYWKTACRRRVVTPIGEDSHDFAERVFADIVDGPVPLRNSLLVLDEITLHSEFRAKQSLKTLILQGRRLGIKMLVACQRLALIPDVMLSEATELVCFRFSRPRDLFVLETWSDRETAETCRQLTVGRCIVVEL
jgi:hypothetical protein